MIATPIGKAILSGRVWRPLFLLRDDFTTDAVAPLTTPRTAEPGPGTLTITDTNSKASVSGAALAIATGGVTTGNPGLWGTVSFARLAGRAVVGKLNFSAPGLEVGWDGAQTGILLDSVRFGSGQALGVRESTGSQVNVETWVTSTNYFFAAVLRGTGVFGFVKGGVFTNWTLIWVGATDTTTPLYPGISAVSATDIGTLDTFRVLDLPAPFNDSYGLATQRLAGARAVNDVFSHTANCVIEWVQTTAPSSNAQFNFRVQDASNYWTVLLLSDGSIGLREVIAGASNLRASAGVGALVSGYRFVIVADGTTIRVYSNNVLRFTYSSASNFATATSGSLPSLGTGGAISDIISWPRTLSAPASTILDLAMA